YASGTSFAAPQVAGIAALVWSLRPELTSLEIAALLTETASRPAGAGWTPRLGFGVVDARAAAERLAGKSFADAIRIEGLHVSGKRAPGFPVRVSVRANWSDQMPVRRGATPRC